MYLLHSWWRLEAGTSITKGYEHSPSAWGWKRITKGYTPGLEAFEGFLLTTCFWEQGLLFHDKAPFRVSPKLCYGLGGGNCILCLNALMFIWNGYMQVCLMLYSLKIIKLHNWIINFVSPLEAVPECPFQSAVLRALQRPWCRERFKAKEEGGREWGGYIASPTQWAWIWANPGRQWRRGAWDAAVHGVAELDIA